MWAPRPGGAIGRCSENGAYLAGPRSHRFGYQRCLVVAALCSAEQCDETVSKGTFRLRGEPKQRTNDLLRLAEDFDMKAHWLRLPCQDDLRASWTHSPTLREGRSRIKPQNLSLRGSSPPPLLSRNQPRNTPSATSRRSHVIESQSPRSSTRRMMKLRCSLRSRELKSQSQKRDSSSDGRAIAVLPLLTSNL